MQDVIADSGRDDGLSVLPAYFARTRRFLTLTILVGTFVSPWIVGRRLTLNPVVIFWGLIFWGWLWGIPGTLLAEPMLAMFQIFCDHIQPLAPLEEFLG